MSKGHDKERQLKQRLEHQGWWVARAAGSLGDADLVALQRTKLNINKGLAQGETYWPPNFRRALLIEIKSNKLGGPYHNFRPEDRKQLSEAARRAGAEAWLVWWLPRREPEWIAESSWPENRKVAA